MTREEENARITASYRRTANMTWEERFWHYTNREGPVHPRLGTRCWDWTGSIMRPGGYGQFSFNGRTRTAHSVSYQMHHGVLTPGQSVLHKCDRPVCVNPDHLFAGTAKDNAEDMARKARTAGQKLTVRDVREIVMARRAGISAAVVARMYRVTQNTINDIDRGHTWSHINKESPP